jgi:hypothetical protein
MQDVTEASGLFWATVFGAALGVVAGTIIQFFITLALEKKSKARQKDALMKEMIYNKSLVCELSKEIQKFRNAVNGGVLNKYFGYFPYSKAIFAQANASANNGMLYEFLSIDHIKNAQQVVSVLSVNTENWVNNEITRRRDILIKTPESFDRAEIVGFVDFIDKQIQELEQTIDVLIAVLQ